MPASSLADLGTWHVILLVLSVGVALSFEFVNGFHDTANAVATVIYAKALKARTAVILSGICNFVGVHVGGIAVAYAIVHLLPVDLLVSVNTSRGLSMVFALLVAAIVWNLGTWALGLPASSSHTLIGSILGVGLANAWREGLPLTYGVNWARAAEVGLSLLISPIIGFVMAWVLLRASRRLLAGSRLDAPPKGEAPPPPGVRATLIVSGLGVSLAHGSNDGQKGVGLIMLILIGFMPGGYALNLACPQSAIVETVRAARELKDLFRQEAVMIESAVDTGRLPEPESKTMAFPVSCGVEHAKRSAKDVQTAMAGRTSLASLSPEERWTLRTNILCLNDAITRLEEVGDFSADRLLHLEDLREKLRAPVEYAPNWVLLAVSLALGLGTMIGWRRIVVTIGERIGKTRLTYAQGAAAQITAMTAIGLADVLGLPVSTTHVLSSGVAGSMAARGSGLQAKTLRSIALAWVLTLPAAMLLGALAYWLFALFV